MNVDIFDSVERHGWEKFSSTLLTVTNRTMAMNEEVQRESES